MIADDEIGTVLSERGASLDDAADELVRRANKAGGQDNITVVAFELTDEPDERTLEQTVEHTAPTPAVVGEPDGRSGRRRFLPLMILVLAILVAAAVLWVLVQR